MTSSSDFLDLLAKLESTPESVGVGLRLDLSQVIHRYLSERGLSQKEFAAKCGMKPPLLARIMYSNANCTFDTAGRILFAMGVRGKLSTDRRNGKSENRIRKLSALNTVTIKESNGKEEIVSADTRIPSFHIEAAGTAAGIGWCEDPQGGASSYVAGNARAG